MANSEGPGQGSEFVVTLPALTAISVLAGRRPARSGHASREADHATAHRILVVDDVRESAETLAMVLRSMGQDATALCDGESCHSVDPVESARRRLFWTSPCPVSTATRLRGDCASTLSCTRSFSWRLRATVNKMIAAGRSKPVSIFTSPSLLP